MYQHSRNFFSRGRLAASPHRRPRAHRQIRKWVFHIQGALITSKEVLLWVCPPLGLGRKFPGSVAWQQKPSQGRSPGVKARLESRCPSLGADNGLALRVGPVCHVEKRSEGW